MGACRLVFAAALAAAALVLAGCGGSGAKSTEQATETGRAVFARAGCGTCHALTAAGATGTVGPSLDALRPSRERVERQVRSGGRGMPSFARRLSKDEIEAVAAFVAASARGTGAPAAFRPTGTTLEDCERQPAGGCFEQAFGNLAYERGPKAALERFAREIQTNPAVEADCHPIAHTIGAAALLRFQGDVGQAFAAGSGACGSGYYHGLLEWKLAGLSEAKVAGVARDVCADSAIRVSSFSYYQCVHGLGHGLMLYTRYDLPGALDLCHRLRTGFDRVSCSGGVFMENQRSSYGLTSKWLREDDLLYPCGIVSRADKLYCYLLVTSQILPRVGWDWGQTADWCRRSEEGFVSICFQSYGRDASGSSRQDPVRIRDYCGRAGDGQRECLFGAVRDVLNNDPGDLRARRLCESLRGGERSYCFFGIGTILGAVHATPAARRAACARFAAGSDAAECEQGAGAPRVS